MTRSLEELFADYQETLAYPMDFIMRSVNDRTMLGDYPIHIAAIRGDVTDLLLLIGNSADVNCKGDEGMTPLHSAIMGNHFDVVEELLKNGADQYIKDDSGEDAMSFLTKDSDVRIAGLLRQYGNV